jgi:hypothetical protein
VADTVLLQFFGGHREFPQHIFDPPARHAVSLREAVRFGFGLGDLGA